MTEPLLISAPNTPSLPVSYRQGVILTWNTATLENTVRVGGPGGPVFENLPVLGVAETATYQPGDVVGLINLGWTLAIIGQLVIPGSPQALSALSFLSSRIFVGEQLGSDSTSSSTFTDLASGVGPIVPDVLIGPSGRAVVIASCLFNYGAVNNDSGGVMGYIIEGATTVAANDSQGPFSYTQSSADYTIIDSKSLARVVSNLNPGLHTFTAKYRAPFSGTVCNFSDRVIVVIAL
jgi:hypothetical protein